METVRFPDGHEAKTADEIRAALREWSQLADAVDADAMKVEFEPLSRINHLTRANLTF